MTSPQSKRKPFTQDDLDAYVAKRLAEEAERATKTRP